MRRSSILGTSIAIGFLLAPLTEAGATERLGRLFYTPAERAELERSSRTESRGQSRTGTLDGRVVRSDGKTSVWINGALHEKMRGDFPGSALYGAKVGETIELERRPIVPGANGGSVVPESGSR